MRTRLVIADDHPIVLDGLAQLFASEKDFDVVARCTNGDEALAAIRRLRPDLAMIDIRMPATNGIEILRRVHDEHLPTRVVLLTAEISDDAVVEAIRLGVCGIVLKEMAPRLLAQGAVLGSLVLAAYRRGGWGFWYGLGIRHTSLKV